MKVSVFLDSKSYKKEPICLVNKNEEAYSNYSDDYLMYLRAIEKWIKTKQIPKCCSDKFELKEVASNDFDEEYMHSDFYLDRYMKVRKLLKQEEITILGEVAEIYTTRPNNHIEIQEGDIIIPSAGLKDIQLVRKETRDKMQVNSFNYIVRPKKISPNYLFFYFKTQTGKIIMEMSYSGTIVARLTRINLNKLPILIQKNSNNYYHTIINQFFDNEKFMREYDYFEDLKKIGYIYNGATEILEEEIVEKNILYYKNLKKEVLDIDLAEIKSCYSIGAYKASTILVGSVVEAFLLDWLSEIDQVNYLDQNIKDVQFCACINKLERKIGVSWKDMAKKAHIIRKARNLVHPKLFLNRNEINRQTTQELVNNLEEIVASRGN
ncbi:hypothetical protein ACFOKE_06295 [Enterococcus rivorum]|uniref:hypothetical protein n=1 Tax=Enterococcus rivorum TaxID=762845 RepID=UPI003611B725